MNFQLSSTPKRIIDEIKTKLPETAPVGSFAPGQVTRLITTNGYMYRGEALSNKIHELAICLEVLFEDVRHWKWGIWHFPYQKLVMNEHSEMFIFPLSDKRDMVQNDVLHDLSYRTTNPTFNPGTTALLCFKPRQRYLY